MKRIIIVLLFLSVLTLFVACGKSEKAEFVDNLIANLGEITRNSGPAIEQAEKEVEALSTEDYEDLENLNILKEARAKYEDIFVSEVEQEIAKITDAKVETEDIVIHAREVYDNLDKNLYYFAIKQLDYLRRYGILYSGDKNGFEI